MCALLVALQQNLNQTQRNMGIWQLTFQALHRQARWNQLWTTLPESKALRQSSRNSPFKKWKRWQKGQKLTNDIVTTFTISGNSKKRNRSKPKRRPPPVMSPEDVIKKQRDERRRIAHARLLARREKIATKKQQVWMHTSSCIFNACIRH